MKDCTEIKKVLKLLPHNSENGYMQGEQGCIIQTVEGTEMLHS